MKRNTLWMRGAFLALCTLLAAPAAEAAPQEPGFGISYQKHSKNGSFGVSWNSDRHWNGGAYYGKRHGSVAAYRPNPYDSYRHSRRVWIPARYERIWCEPVYETRYDGCGRPYTVCVSAGYWKTIHHAGYYERRSSHRRRVVRHRW